MPTWTTAMTWDNSTTNSLVTNRWIISNATSTSATGYDPWCNGTATTTSIYNANVYYTPQLEVWTPPPPRVVTPAPRVAPVPRRDPHDDRARDLLLAHLSPEQRRTFIDNGWFIVEGGRSKTKYRIRNDRGLVANIDVLDGSPVRLCAHCRHGAVTFHDHLLAQKVHLELNEDDFLRTANRHRA
jgi:hypothetical protein